MVMFPGPGGGDIDPLWDDVKFLCLCQGADTSTAFTDAKGRHLITPVNAGVIDTAQTLGRGVSSGYADGTDDGFSVANSADFAPGTGPFTVEMFIRPEVALASNSIQVLIGVWTGADYGWRIFLWNNAGTMQLAFGYSDDGTTQETDLTGDYAFAAGTDYFIAVTIASSTVRLFAGLATASSVSQVGTGTLTGSIFNSSEPLEVGGSATLGVDFQGWWQGPRITSVDRSGGTTSMSVPPNLFPTRGPT